jgi:peptidoglycan hydrolase-like protein with peptidoglycan-binding domain
MPDIIPTIPETITVHLGSPRSEAQNVTLSFPDYIKNVASSEIYPTWPESAIRANIYAQISFALNRVFTEFYRNQGYDFQITNSTAYDQSFVYGRDIFENISQIVDEIFNSYIRRQGSVEPLFAAYCDGVEIECEGLSQWGSAELAEQGLSPYEILQYYYGDDIDIVQNVPIEGIDASAPAVPLSRGSSGPNVELAQIRLNRISSNYPLIPKIYPTDGIFDATTEEAVKAFQSTFGLTPDGIIGPATWYRIQYIYTAVKRLSDLSSEGLTIAELDTGYPQQLGPGDTGFEVRIIQYYLAYISTFVSSVPSVTVDGSFGPSTEAAVRAFQTTYGLPATGIVDEATWNQMYNVYLGSVEAIPFVYTEGVTLPFPGNILRIGSEGEDVRVLQNYLNFIARTYTDIPILPVTGYFGSQTNDAVIAFQDQFGITESRGVVNSFIWDAITDVYDDLYVGQRASTGQYPGYDLSSADNA